ncbi:MAG: acetate kinase [Candidatus Firestonebacteria bacterium]
MKILVLNSGSSSIKYKLYEMPKGDVLVNGMIDKIGDKASKIKQEANGKKIEISEFIKDHESGLHRVFDLFIDKENGVLKSLSEIGAVGHRVVHGAEDFTGSVIINDEVIKTIEKCCDLAPLHNPPNLAGIIATTHLLPGVTQVAAFDTAFHQTIPPTAYIYPIPYDYYTKYRVRKYGFHGTSHRYVARRAAELLEKGKYEVNVITCHLGNGCSLAAVKEGKSVDTSMGLTPLEGVPMGTRSGDIDPALIFFLAEKENLKLSDINGILNKKSGLVGISGFSNDMRDLEHAQAEGKERAKLAIAIFCYRIKKYIGSYMAVLNKVDAIVFTGGIGERGPYERAEILKEMEHLGISLDKAKNENKEREKDISTPESKVKVLVIPTDEEGAIARDTFEMTSKN